MASDDRVDLLSRLETEQVERLLPLIAQAERNDIRKLLSFPEDSAGAIMTTEYASLPEDITVAEALNRLRQQAPDRGDDLLRLHSRRWRVACLDLFHSGI